MNTIRLVNAGRHPYAWNVELSYGVPIGESYNYVMALDQLQDLLQDFFGTEQLPVFRDEQVLLPNTSQEVSTSTVITEHEGQNAQSGVTLLDLYNGDFLSWSSANDAAWSVDRAGVVESIKGSARVPIHTAPKPFLSAESGSRELKEKLLKIREKYANERNATLVNDPWFVVHASASRLILGGDHIGVISQGHAYVKEGDRSATWKPLSENVTQLVLAGDRIGVISDGNAYVKQGPLDASWGEPMHKNVSQLVLAGDRIGVISGGNAYVKQGGLDASWTPLAEKAAQVVLDYSSIGVVSDGEASLKSWNL